MDLKPTVPEVMPLVRAYYAKPGNTCGGSLHCVLDDGNTENCHVESAIEFAIEEKDEDGERLARILLRMSRTQRDKISRLIYRG